MVGQHRGVLRNIQCLGRDCGAGSLLSVGSVFHTRQGRDPHRQIHSLAALWSFLQAELLLLCCVQVLSLSSCYLCPGVPVSSCYLCPGVPVSRVGGFAGVGSDFHSLFILSQVILTPPAVAAEPKGDS